MRVKGNSIKGFYWVVTTEINYNQWRLHSSILDDNNSKGRKIRLNYCYQKTTKTYSILQINQLKYLLLPNWAAILFAVKTCHFKHQNEVNYIKHFTFGKTWSRTWIASLVFQPAYPRTTISAYNCNYNIQTNY